MVTVAAGRRAGAAGGVGGRRRSGCGGAGQAAQQNSPLQQKLLAVAVAARFAEAGPPPSTEASGAGAGGCCVELLDCLLGALNVSVATVTPAPAQYGWAVREIRPRGEGSAEDRHADAPSGRIAGNGASANAAASLYTMQGRKGVNQDAMVVWEVTLISISFLMSIQQIIGLFSPIFPIASSLFCRAHLRDVKLVSRML